MLNNKFKKFITLFFVLVISNTLYSEDITFTLETNIASNAAYTDDTLQIFLSALNNTTNDIPGDLYMIIIKPDGGILYFPGWTTILNKISLTIPGSLDFAYIELPRIIFGDNVLSIFGEYTVACGFLTNSGWASNFGITKFHYIEQDFFTILGDKTRFMVGKKPQMPVSCDMNGDDINDIVTTCRDSGCVSIMPGKGDGSVKTQLIFFVGKTPLEPAISDINNDGKPDIIVTNYDDKNISVLTNLGNLTFEQTKYEVGEYPTPVVTADLNNDGFLDLVNSNRGYWNISVLMNKKDGTFETQANYSAGEGPDMPAIADLNGDGFPDVCVSNQNIEEVSILINNGDGTFAVEKRFPAARNYQQATLSDINNDNSPDIIMGSNTGVIVLTNDGSGNFSNKTVYAPPQSASKVEMADFNNDGYLDIVTTGADESFRTSFFILFNNGDGTFTEAKSWEFGVMGSAAVPVELTGDNLVDIVIGHAGQFAIYYRNELKVFKNMGNGNFELYGIYYIASIPNYITTTDIDSDGKQDIVVSNQGSDNISILYNKGDGILSSEMRPHIPCGDSFEATLADVSSDGFLDVLITSLNKGIFVYLNNEDGTLSAGVKYDLSTNPFNPLDTADLDNDGDIDIFVSGSSKSSSGANVVSVFLNNGDGTFAPEAGYPVGEGPSYFISFDLNSDGYIDIVTSNSKSNDLSILTNKGDGTFELICTLPVGTTPKNFTAADFDKDEFKDIVVCNYESYDLSLFINDRHGSFEPEVRISDIKSPGDIHAVDVNNDTYDDIVVSSRQGVDGVVYILINKGNGTFNDKISYSTGINPRNLEFADLDNDNFVDIITRNDASYDITILLNNGDGSYRRAGDDINIGKELISVKATDFDGDGNQDIFVTRSDKRLGSVYGNLLFFLGNGDGTFKTPIWSDLGSGPQKPAIGDMNKDGLPDLVVSNSSFDLFLLFNTGYSYK